MHIKGDSIDNGTISDSVLSPNVSLLTANQVFFGTNMFQGVLVATNPANQFAGTFTGNGAGLSNLNGSQLASGTVADARLSTNVALLNANQVFTGVKTFNNSGNNFTGLFHGNAAGLTNYPASGIIGGLTINVAVMVPGGKTNTFNFTNGILMNIQ